MSSPPTGGSSSSSKTPPDSKKTPFSGGGSCLPTDAFSHFTAREAELLKYNEQLEARKNDAIAKASEAMKDVENLSFKNYQPSFLKNDALVQPLMAGSGLDLKDPRKTK